MLDLSTGQALHSALSEEPAISLHFYSYGVTLRKRDGDAITEYPVDVAQIAAALAARISLTTGLLTGDTLYVHTEGVSKTIAVYRAPQVTGVYLDGSESALRVPLPPLVMIRKTDQDRTPTYSLFAVKKRPVSLDEPLFHAPLPNVFTSAAICWGTVQRVTDESLHDASLAEDFRYFLGSPFGNHACHGKSKSHPDDIRQKWLALEAKGAKRYPISDLIPTRKTLGQVLS